MSKVPMYGRQDRRDIGWTYGHHNGFLVDKESGRRSTGVPRVRKRKKRKRTGFDPSFS
jgi:hypothetical protein